MEYKPIRQLIVAYTGTDLYLSCPISRYLEQRRSGKKENIGAVEGRISDVQCTYGSDMG